MADLDFILELLDDKIVKTNDGLFIRVEDLRSLSEQFKQIKEDEKGAQPPPRTMSEARESLLKNREWMERFKKLKEPINVTEADLVKNVTEGSTNEAA